MGGTNAKADAKDQPVLVVSWQVVPTVLGEMLQDKDREKSRRVMAAILKMKKINIEALKKAYEGRFDSASGGGQ